MVESLVEAGSRVLADDVSSLTGPSAYFFAYLGCAVALVFSNLGSAYGTAKSGVGLMSMGVMNYQLVMKNIIPCIMAGVLGIYGLITAVILNGGITPMKICTDATDCFTYADGYRSLAAGLCVGLSGLGAGMAIGVVGDAGVRACGQQEKLYVGMILILIFAEALGLYGLIVALILASSG